jgi:hypothetical protein
MFRATNRNVAPGSDLHRQVQMAGVTSSGTWLGRGLSAIVIVLLFADAVAQLVSFPMLRTEMEASGFPFELSPIVGTITMSSVIIYAIPRTAIFGAILLSGFIGGAISLHLRLGEIGSPPQIVCLLLGAMTWGGLYLREPQLRKLIGCAP